MNPGAKMPGKKRSGSRRLKQGMVIALTVAIGGFGYLSRRGEQGPVDLPPVPLSERVPKVLVIGIDGVRPDILAEVPTPNIDALALGGTFTARARTTIPSVSGPSWSSMLTGVWPDKHGVRGNDFEGRRFLEYPDFLTRIESVRPELSTFAALDWMPLMEIEGGDPTLSEQIDERVAVDGYELGWLAADGVVVERSIRQLSTADPDAMFVYLGNPDETSHQYESIGGEYREAIAAADGHVGALIAAVRARPDFRHESWLVIVSTDHGRREDGGHGGLTPEEMTIFLLVSGPGAARGTPQQPTFIVDVAVTALAHLGIPIDPAWDLDGQVVGLP